MRITYFGIAHEITGKRHEELNVNTPLSIAELKQLLVEKYPALHHIQSYSIACNEEYVSDDLILEDASNTLAVIPPVSGG